MLGSQRFWMYYNAIVGPANVFFGFYYQSAINLALGFGCLLCALWAWSRS
jgi:hypothetical protein